MGTWGMGIYDGDFPCDVRDEYKNFLREGQSPEDALKSTVQVMQPDLDDEEGFLFWPVIADVQWSLGHLGDEIRSKALEALASDENQERWLGISSKDKAKRKAAVEALVQKLCSPQPKPKKLRKQRGVIAPWKIGDLLSVKLKCIHSKPNEIEIESLYKGKYVLAHVVGYFEQPTSCDRHPVMDRHAVLIVYNWVGSVPADSSVAQSSHVLNTQLGWSVNPGNCFIIPWRHTKQEQAFFDIAVVGHSEDFPPVIKNLEKVKGNPLIWSTCIYVIACALYKTRELNQSEDIPLL